MMGKGIRYTDEFKQEAANQVVVHGYPVSEVSQDLIPPGISTLCFSTIAGRLLR
jgi:hypothetical protein